VRFDLAAIVSYTLFIFLKMKKNLILVFILLLLLTITTACISGLNAFSGVVGILILIFATFKFLLVAFHFMELKKAHSFWKISLMLTLLLFVIVIVSLK